VPHIATQYHFAAKLYRQDLPEIASQSILDFKIFQGRTPTPTAARLRRAWVLTEGQHIVRHPNQISGSMDPSLQKNWIRPWYLFNKGIS
jgi:hypothetical protein